MATKITPEKIKEINELYYKLRVKKRVAEAMGISPSTVSKYIIPGYIPETERVIPAFDKEPLGCAALANSIKESDRAAAQVFAELCELTDEEWDELDVLQKEVMI